MVPVNFLFQLRDSRRTYQNVVRTLQYIRILRRQKGGHWLWIFSKTNHSSTMMAVSVTMFTYIHD